MDLRLGALTRNPELGWWSGRGEVAPGQEIDVHLEAADEPAELQAAVERAKMAWDCPTARQSLVRAAVADQLVRAHNDFCNPEDEVTADQFADRLRLLSARFMASGVIELVYVGEQLLGEHWIVVRIGKDGSVGEAFEAG